MKNFINWCTKASISRKLIISFIVILIIPILVLEFSSYHTASSSLDEQISGNAKNNIDSFNTTITNDIGAKAKAIEFFSETLKTSSFTKKNKSELEGKFGQYTSIHKDVARIYGGTEDGSYTQAPKENLPAGYDPRTRTWYKDAVKAGGGLVVTDPYIAANDGSMVVTVAQQLQDGSGVVAMDITIDQLLKQMQEIKIGQKGFVFIVSKNKTYVAHKDHKPGEKVSTPWVNEVYSNNSGIISYKLNNQDKKMAFTTNKLTGWKIAGSMELNEIKDASKPVLTMGMIVLGASVIIGGILILLIVRSITTPLKRLVRSSKQISGGDLTETIDIRSKDELGELGASFNEMGESLRGLISAIQSSVDNVAASSEQLTASASQTSKATEHITMAIEQFSNGNEEQSEKVESSSAKLNHMNDGLLAVSQTSAAITEASKQSTEIAGTGETYVQKTVGQMKLINQSVQQAEAVVKGLEAKSKDITHILRVINGIADQTNLLALNAAIEAARAGEYGRGFSVVAEEVRKLAVQSADSSKEIEKLIQEITAEIDTSLHMFTSVNEEVQSGLTVTDRTKESFQNIFGMTNEIAEKLQSMNSTVEQLSDSSQHVSAAVTDIADVSRESAASIQDIAASAEEQLASMEEISTSADTLAQMAEELRELTKQFKIN
ncbi:methyl-accepting chemotaxis protein TlpB [Bacillus nakamurai]|uniref:methyl-accepting chemotaxis protein TlpB n=1 Tax=Bacillus nakamurai TaxID=1793963 RepID=UPI001E58EA86|nr:methyl-accepting chemotaxis protein [Bacillus nakamurai]MCC9024187.1 methyl-accepting chemotaxis protein [Bacillus nakamurai]MCP6682395.1 methyl-accepting chemotaxis protein [Bacillus nakamurai]